MFSHAKCIDFIYRFSIFIYHIRLCLFVYVHLGPCYDEDGQEYPLTTKVECDDDEILCKGASPGNGCPGQDVCVPRGVDKNGGLCEGFCPIECEEDTLHCQEPIDHETGCAKPPTCIAKSVNIYGEFCPHQQCPLLCLEIEFFSSPPPVPTLTTRLSRHLYAL